MMGEFMDFDLTIFWIVIARAFLSLVVLFLICKLLGKKQVAQLSMFDYVIGISIGNFAAEITINLDVSFIYGVVAVVVFGLVAYFISVITMKSMFLRKFLMGKPTILIDHGELSREGLKEVKFDVNDLLEECRNSGYFDLSEIEYAVMESNGRISILPKSENKPVTIKDMNLKTSEKSLCANIIIDGKLMSKILGNMNKSEEWLKNQLKVKGYKDYSKILLATLDSSDKLIIYEKDKKEIKNVLE